ncbi:DUF2637 domain-containing protein [Nonomuraea insulae]|uniref:DUF2637 domain-containing protein n=1 Tax=Nonomuraea insulae TaxID=1616787 RepID=A0ABW1CXC0_9ACTN
MVWPRELAFSRCGRALVGCRCRARVRALAGAVSFRHMSEPAIAHGEDELAAALIPLAVDGTIVAASMSLLRASRHGARGGALPWVMSIVR